MSVLNLGIVAHVDAGKTSLTERLLFEAGETDALGSVDAGTTRTDSLELERRRGITIRAAVTSFALDDLEINLIDTPGHPDFIAEVERSLAVFDGAVLVVSAVEGVQPQTVVLWRALRRVGIPTLIFVNKVDRSGADVARVVDQIRRRLQPRVAILTRADGEGRRDATVHAIPFDDSDVVEAVAAVDDGVLAQWVDDEPPDPRGVRRVLQRAVRAGAITPVLCGSAITGAGTPQLRAALAGYLSGAPDGTGELSATVFAVERDGRGRRMWLRMWSGELHVRDRVAVRDRRAERVTEVGVSRPGGLQTDGRAVAGDVAVVRGPQTWRVGDVVGRPPDRPAHRFPPPTMQAVIESADPDRRIMLLTGLTEMADEDPLIDLRIDDTEGEATIRLHGEVQKEVISSLLEQRYGVRARFRETRTVCIERVVGSGAALEQIGIDDNPYLATIGLRVEAAPLGRGIQFDPGVERGHLLPAFLTATKDGLRSALRQGLFGWEVMDCTVTMTSSHYWPRQSHAHQKFNKAFSSVGADFRNLAPVVVMAALHAAGTQVCEPYDRFELDLPDEWLNPVAGLLGRLGAVTLESSNADGWTRLAGHLRSSVVPTLTSRLPDLSSREAVLVARFDHYAPVADGSRPARRRTGPDPRDRATWFRDVPR